MPSKKKRVEKVVEDIFIDRDFYHHAIARENLEDALKHTLKVLNKGKRRQRRFA